MTSVRRLSSADALRPCLSAALIAAFAFPADAQSSGGARQVVPRLEPTVCDPAPAPGQRIDCAVLVVWEDRAREGRVVRLPVTIYRSRSTPAPDPVLYMAGGPGRTVQRMSSPSALLESRDYITLEARGTRTTVPSLDCPGITELRSRMNHGLLSGAALDSAWTRVAVQCARDLRARGVDLAAYTTRAVAEDAEDLRRVLKIDRWNLYGESYSTRIMLTLMRDHPASIRSAVLDSPLPLESRYDEVAASSALRIWDIAFDTCAVVAACAARHPRPRGLFAQAIHQFEENPRWVRLSDASRPDSVLLTGALLGYNLGSMINAPGNAQASMRLLEKLATGDASPLVLILDESAAPSSFAWGMRMLIWCADVVPFEDRARVSAQRDRQLGLGGASFTVVPGPACDAAGIPASPASEGEPVRSDVPTLVLTGAIDPNTPTPWARGLVANLPNAFVIELAGLGHVPGFRPCGAALIDAFVRDPSRPPTDVCVAHSPGLTIR